MKNMVVQSNELKKTCCFYVSEFHLEMILMPYIREKIEQDITIISDKNLKETLDILINKVNLNEEIKQKVQNLGWEGNRKIKENSNVIIIGEKSFIENKNKEINNKNVLSVLDCYDFEKEKDNIANIIKNYNNSLNTMGITSF